MWRFVKEMNIDEEPEQKVYGVLTDYDLSSWADSMGPDYTETSQQRTGTLPYMAQEVLKGTSQSHLYRHDVESLFNIMLLMSARHTIGIPEGEEKPRVVMQNSGMALPYQDWFNEPQYHKLGSIKGGFFSDMEAIELSPTFEDFRVWLQRLRCRFSEGFALKNAHVRRQRREEWGRGPPGEPVPFDNETLGGWIDYPSLIETARQLEGQLEGLTVRYDPKPVPPAPTSTGVQAYA